MSSIAIFDGHNDALYRLYRARAHRPFLLGDSTGHVDLPRAHQGNLGAGFFAVYVPPLEVPALEPTVAGKASDYPDLTVYPDGAGYEVRLAAPVPLDHSRTAALAMTATLFRLEADSKGRLKVVRTVAQLRHCLSEGILAAVLHFEGAEPIDPDLDALEVFHQAGLRSLGIVWSRPNAFGHGVQFKFPSSPDTGPGLTRAGKRLVKACNRLGIMVDVSHLTERGFWDVAKLSAAPLVATHCNAHAVCPSSRNLTDEQLDAVAESGGVVGVMFDVSQLRPDGANNPHTPLSYIVRHIDHMAERMGIDHVAFGSDFDGCVVSAELGDVAGMGRLLAALRARGYSDGDLHQLACGNWVRVLERTWKS